MLARVSSENGRKRHVSGLREPSKLQDEIACPSFKRIEALFDYVTGTGHPRELFRKNGHYLKHEMLTFPGAPWSFLTQQS